MSTIKDEGTYISTNNTMIVAVAETLCQGSRMSVMEMEIDEGRGTT